MTGMHRDIFKQQAWIVWALAYLATYLALEWATYRHDVSPLGITPWNPSAGLSLALLLHKGVAWAPAIAAALIAADLTIRQVPFPWWVELAEVVVTVASTALAARFLLRRAGGLDAALSSMRSLLRLLAVAIVTAMVVAAGYVAVLAAAGLITQAAIVDAMLRHWAGDVIGTMAVTPFLLVTSQNRLPPLDRETVLQFLSILVAIGVVLGGNDGLREHLYYLLFLPIVWIAVRHGITGASSGLFALQIGLLSALQIKPEAPANIVALQAALLILLFSGLAIGVLTSERELMAARLRRQQAHMARVARSASMGSLSSSLAHEISQPLTAIANYVRAAQRSLAIEPPRLAEASENLRTAGLQIERASGTMKKLRRLFELGQIDLAPHRASDLAAECRSLMAAEAAEHGVSLHFEVPDADLIVMADRLQLIVVLTNLVRNAIEALEESAPERRRISITIAPGANDTALFSVTDEGPGFPPGFDLAMHAVGQSDKAHGLGVGLALCKTIIEAHDSRLQLVQHGSGATLMFSLARAKGE